ncbi:phage portal protein [Neobacillus niacini]|uniref:phage portal protein n=1 Tax=Neobacillus niacini TaxID=86668 RepID=UPI0009E08851|nr:phage portal protein [Neobacillus niacini]
MALFNKSKQENIELRNQLAKLSEEVEEIRSSTVTIGGVEISSNSFISGVPSGAREENVVKIATASACLDLITNTIAQMPVFLYKENAEDGSIEKVIDKRVNLLNHENQEHMNAIDFKKLMLKDYILHGQAIANIGKQSEPVSVGGMIEEVEELTELNHLPSKNVQVDVFHNGYKYVDADYHLTTITGQGFKNKTDKKTFKPDQLLRVMNNPVNPFEANGVLVRGQSLFEQALAEIEYTKNLYNNSAVPTGVLKMTGRLTQGMIDRLRQSWQSIYTGSKNSAKTVILEEGLDYKPLSLNPNELQISETSKSTATEICKLFGVPESMITTAANKYGSIEQNQLHFLKHTLSPIIHSFECALDKSLLLEQEKRDGYFFRFETAELLRTTEGERTNNLSKQLNDGAITLNEYRSALDKKPYDDDFIKFTIAHALYNPKTGEMKVPNMDGGTNQNE